MTDTKNDSKRGYLNEDFRLFHIKDSNEPTLGYHYHDFDKLVILISGKVTYVVEGKNYFLKPWDILMVSRNQIHKPIIEPDTEYERIVIWVKRSFINRYNYENTKLDTCFSIAKKYNVNLIRMHDQELENMKSLLDKTEKSLSSKHFAHELMANTYLLQLLITLNKVMFEEEFAKYVGDYYSDPKIEEIIKYITNNLSSELSVDTISSKFFMSKFNLMRKFKAQTGMTLHKYITQKRLVQAADMIREGISSAEASYLSGFQDYSSFLRAFKSEYNTTPRNFIQ